MANKGGTVLLILASLVARKSEEQGAEVGSGGARCPAKRPQVSLRATHQ